MCDFHLEIFNMNHNFDIFSLFPYLIIFLSLRGSNELENEYKTCSWLIFSSLHILVICFYKEQNALCSINSTV